MLPTNDHSQTNALAAIKAAAVDRAPIRGLTHRFYRYPARFSPIFARTCIEAYSSAGQVVFDPYMGGGTTILEAMVSGRRAIGSDINSLAVFITKAKVTRLTHRDKQAILAWSSITVPSLRCNDSGASDGSIVAYIPRNMAQPETRWLRKTISLCLAAVDDVLGTDESKCFARCVLLNVGQWALNGRRSIPTASEFRNRIVQTTMEMLEGLNDTAETITASGIDAYKPVLCQSDAEQLDEHETLSSCELADLVVTSPPYPGIHMLYHRWQVDGRKETDTPYWIAGCTDGSGASYYNFGDRRLRAEDDYFHKAEASFSAVRRRMKRGAILAQMIAFSSPQRQLRRYLRVMERAGFQELRNKGSQRIWRSVPGRSWYANYKGKLPSSRELVLIHEAT